LDNWLNFDVAKKIETKNIPIILSSECQYFIKLMRTPETRHSLEQHIGRATDITSVVVRIIVDYLAIYHNKIPSIEPTLGWRPLSKYFWKTNHNSPFSGKQRLT